MSMSAGFEAALRSTGRPDNAIVVQRGSGSELTSGVPLADRNMIVVDDRVARDAQGQPLASGEFVVVARAAPREQRPAGERDAPRGDTEGVRGARGDPPRRRARVHPGARRGHHRRPEAHEPDQGLELGGNVKYQQKLFRIVGDSESVGGRRVRERDLGRLRHVRGDLPARRGEQLPRSPHEGPGRDPGARPLDPRPAPDAAQGDPGEEVLRGPGGPPRPDSPGARRLRRGGHGDRRRLRRDQHHVRDRLRAHPRDRHPPGPRLPAARDPRGRSSSSPSSSRWSGGRSGARWPSP